MIRKFLICGKQQMYMQSKNLDSYREIGKVIELLMPVKSYWVITEELKLANYQMSAGESPAEVMVTYRKIFGLFDVLANTS